LGTCLVGLLTVKPTRRVRRLKVRPIPRGEGMSTRTRRNYDPFKN
jgi:hypothetical protein